MASIPRIPQGGITDQYLVKASSQNYDTKWITPYRVGQFAFGGVIFYVDITGNHGLVAASADEPGGAAYTWGLVTTPGTAQNQCANKAAVDGYGDWFVPSQAQMSMLYFNRYAVGGDPNGGFSNATALASLYWTSTVTDLPANHAWFQEFGLAAQGHAVQATALSARCIRAF